MREPQREADVVKKFGFRILIQVRLACLSLRKMREQQIIWWKELHRCDSCDQRRRSFLKKGIQITFMIRMRFVQLMKREIYWDIFPVTIVRHLFG